MIKALAVVGALAIVTWIYGRLTSDFADALCAAARRGVRVRVVLDAVGAHKLDRGLVDEVREAGAEVAWFNPIRCYS